MNKITDRYLILLAMKMRESQRRYFRTRSPEDLMEAKELERQFDDAAKAWADVA